MTNDVIDLVCARMGAVFALEVDLSTTDVGRESLDMIDGRGTRGIMFEHTLEFTDEGGVALRVVVGLGEFVQSRNERLADIAAPVGAEVSGGIRIITDNFIHGVEAGYA